MTVKEMANIFTKEIPFDEIELNAGIYEFYEEGNKSIGISYENIEGKYVYIFNLFKDGEYINIAGEYQSVCDAAEEVTKVWNER